MLKYSKDDIKLYFDLLGYDIGEDIESYKKGIKLDSLDELFRKYRLNNILPKSSRDLSDSLSVFFAILNDDFWFESEESKNFALKSALEVIRDLSSFEVCNSNNPLKQYERTSNLLTAIISGLCEVSDISRFRLYQRNSGLKLNYCGVSIEDRTDNLVRLYLLNAYSKFMDVGCDYLMFDQDDKVSSEKLKMLIEKNIKDGVPIIKSQYENDSEFEIKRLTLEMLRK